jgi:hypothetical protein
MTGELLDADPRRRLVDAIVSGRWGLLLLFPSTTDDEWRKLVTTIRLVVPKQHKDALNVRGPQLAAWLEVCGFTRAAIARAVFGRQTGLRRPTTAEAIARTSWDHDHELHEEYRKQGLTDLQIDQRIYRRLRGSEARASAAVRMKERRYWKRIEGLNEDLATPSQSEPLSHALTMLFRALADQNDAAVRRHAIAAKVACLRASLCSPIDAAAGGEAAAGLPETIVSGRWGVVPVFPWTTDPDIRALVKKIRDMIRAPRNDIAQPDRATGNPVESEPLSAALTKLFQALPDHDNAAFRRHAVATMAPLIRVPVP